MRQTPVPPDSGFEVDWQLTDEAGTVVDLSAAEAEVLVPDDASVRGAPGLR